MIIEEFRKPRLRGMDVDADMQELKSFLFQQADQLNRVLRTLSESIPEAAVSEGGGKGEKGETGPQGPKGPAGADGTPGYSPTVVVTDITGGHRVTITDADGPNSFDVLDGSIAEIGDSLNVGGKAIIQTIDGTRGNVQLWNESGLITVNAYTTNTGRGEVDVNNNSGQSRAGMYVATDDEGKLVLKDAGGNSQILRHSDIEKLHALYPPETIFEGSWKSGELTVNGISNWYAMYIFAGSQIPMFCINNGNEICGGGATYLRGDGSYFYTFSVLLSGDTISDKILKYNSPSSVGNSGAAITKIIGIIKK